MPRPLSAYQRAVKQKRRVRRGRSPKEQSEAEPRSMRQHAKGVMRFFVGESVKHQIPNPSRPPPPSRSTATASAQAGQSNNTENARPPHQTKTQNGLWNQLNPHPYKPPTAQCESAHPLSKTNHTPKRNSQTTQANSPNALSQKTRKSPKKPPITNQKTQKNNPCQHTHIIFITSHTNLTININRKEKALTHNPCLGFRIKSAWLTPSAGRELYQPPF